MAYFSKIGLNSKVIEVLSVDNSVLLDANGNESEKNGIDFLNILTGWAIWKQTSYNTRGGIHKLGGTPFRKNYGGVGYTYDEDRDAFIPPKPYNSWVLNEETCRWVAPIPEPELTQEQIDNNNYYVWNETNTTWDLTTKE
jgi:hypothetical protein